MQKELLDVFENIKEAAGLIHAHGWAEAYAGNISYRMESSVPYDPDSVTELPDRFENLIGKSIVITSSGSRMRHLASRKTSDFCSVITINGNGTGFCTSAEYNQKPSSELIAHLLLHNEYEKRHSGYRAVVHCHPDEIIALLNLPEFKTSEPVNKMLFSIHSEIQTLLPDGAAIIGSKTPGSYELASSIFNELKKHDIALIERHGCFSTGDDIDEAIDKIEIVEKAVKIYFQTRKVHLK